MDIEKSQRLVKFANCIKEMVDYKEISCHLMQCKVLTLTDHEKFTSCVNERGNPSAMEDLIHLLRLRRGAFNAFVEALRCNDYNWLANQMDPTDFNDCSSESKSMFPMMRPKRRKSIKNETQRLSSETIFTSYRASFPMDLGPTKQSQTMHFRTPVLRDVSSISASLDTLNLDEYSNATNKMPERWSNVNQLAEDQMESEPIETKRIKSTASAIMYNIPEPETKTSEADMQIVSEIAKEVKFPNEYLKGLKAIRIGRVEKLRNNNLGKGLKANGNRPLKIKFKSKDARDKFICLVQCEKLASNNSILEEIQVLPYEGKSMTQKSTPKPIDQCDSNSVVVERKKRHWYQTSFLKKKISKQSKYVSTCDALVS